MADKQALTVPFSTSTASVDASAATAIAANTARIGFSLQNCGTAVLFVRFGAGASSSNFDIVLKAGTGNDDGTGGLLVSGSAGPLYTGIITVASTGTVRYTAAEYTA